MNNIIFKNKAETKKQVNSDIDQPDHGRRGFLTKILLGLGGLAIVEAIAVFTVFLKPRKRTAKGGEFGSLIEAGAAENFTPGTVTAFARGHFFLSRLEDGGFLAFSRRCTHLGCTVSWDDKQNKFLCPCHSSSFDIKGAVINPPAPRALDLFPVFIENEIVKVDTARALQRKRYNPSQAKKPQEPKNWVKPE